jgi:hypothetical protein
MKLRIQRSALRRRVTQKEVAQLHDRSHVESLIEFAPGRTLVYMLEGSLHDTAITATFNGQAIRVMVPMRVMTEWIENDQVSLEALSPAGLQVLVEKVFQCLHKSGDQDPDAYPHPLMS